MAKLDPQRDGHGAGADVKVFPIPCPSCAAEQRTDIQQHTYTQQRTNTQKRNASSTQAADIPDTIAQRVLSADDMRLWARHNRIEHAELISLPRVLSESLYPSFAKNCLVLPFIQSFLCISDRKLNSS
ncbi:uncharacterized protein SCHCODRAFT_02086891 [Schizophyllum commune H4-8]|uniref:uncharacterized protein n=1 Tax=Schizophyllum commune (strain H4-8 / FGSC 9210) TaxID=578458 RepID=UPI0021604A88|nr:uncharacterized protein SCHCODRAFT_02086891 [Schizophyllum commune H4-8]KAI5887019.1 hypothetical protein SCHCODRAFT_02086891 [Schizophyllum commune H4-8]